MENHSKKTIQLLKALDCSEGIAGDELPKGFELDHVEYLVTLGLVRRITFVPPGMEKEVYGRKGLSGFCTSSAGKELVRCADDLQRANRRSRLWSVLMLFIGGAVTLLVEHCAEAASFIKNLCERVLP